MTLNTETSGELLKYVGELEARNRFLNESNDNLIIVNKNKTKHIDELEEENRKLKDVLESLMKKYKIREVGIGDEIIMKTLEK